MKPVKMIMSAFGPYADRAELDLPLGLAGLVLITGPPARVNDHFDAITFALYGESSGSTRGGVETLRSDHASPEAETYVRFTFLHRNKTYTITRNPPAYKRPKRWGKGQLQRAPTQF